MESRLQRAVLAFALLWACLPSMAQDTSNDTDTLLEDVVNPDIERRKIKEGLIDRENLELGFFAGVLSVEDFGSNDVFGGRAGLYITEDIFIEGNIGFSTVQETSFEELNNAQLISDDERDLIYYNLNLGFNIFPGELYIGHWTFNHNFYLIGGAGNTSFAGNEYFTYQFGGGLRLFATDWLAFRVDFRNHLFTHALFGPDKEIQNLESHMGLTLFF